MPLQTGPVALILRSRTAQLQSLQTIHSFLLLTAVVAVLVAILLSFAVARTIAQPLAAITDVMREVAATGDLTRKIAVRHGNRWDDEDARLLATTFNTLTDSIAQAQREISQRERLSSLGRLSTVIAHEVRNPLMIIKASLHSLRQPDGTADAVHEAVHDSDEEVSVLNVVASSRASSSSQRLPWRSAIFRVRSPVAETSRITPVIAASGRAIVRATAKLSAVATTTANTAVSSSPA